MILANELRVGNKFQSCFGRVETVLDIMDNTDRGRIQYVSENHRLMYSHLIIPIECRNQYKPFEINPIELQDAHFVAAGFGCSGSYYWHTKFMQLSFHRPHAKGLPWLVKCVGEHPITSLKHLHQLQNLYFVVTGEELSINL